ncbi:2-dehydropantoate 2-reductase family [Colletotrichum musicola]|uniref:2-dehydropantoate 2-reductase family n=1 Tax=Colletotrichum musicola TaxID=2175873 RepID=A0A8H6K340_9PEZI|nr:2-dehydropantoate 2-reductase family [Colletotrichum musicola]
MSEVLNSVPDTARAAPEQQFGYVVCCTKNVPDAKPRLCDVIAPAVTPGRTAIVLVQNGINIELPFFERFPANVILSGVSRFEAYEVSFGIVEQKQHGVLCIGAFEGVDTDEERQQVGEAMAKRFVEIYAVGGRTVCFYRPNVNYFRWVKLLYDASFNPICATEGKTLAEVRNDIQIMEDFVFPSMREVIRVALADGCFLPETLMQHTVDLYPKNQEVMPGMLLDVQKGNLIEHLNTLGAVMELGKLHSVATPVISILHWKCR